jgi:hypothetical protein
MPGDFLFSMMAIKAGTMGYCWKNIPSEELIPSISELHQGKAGLQNRVEAGLCVIWPGVNERNKSSG